MEDEDFQKKYLVYQFPTRVYRTREIPRFKAQHMPKTYHAAETVSMHRGVLRPRAPQRRCSAGTGETTPAARRPRRRLFNELQVLHLGLFLLRSWREADGADPVRGEERVTDDPPHRGDEAAPFSRLVKDSE